MVNRTLLLTGAGAWLVCVPILVQAFDAPQPRPVVSPSPTIAADVASQQALVNRYCVSCHNQKTKIGGLALDTLDLARIADRADIGEKVIRKVRGGLMPPRGLPRPDAAAYEGFAA